MTAGISLVDISYIPKLQRKLKRANATQNRCMPEAAELFQRCLQTLLREVLDGPPAQAAFVLNPGDRGLLASLDMLSAEAASARPVGRSSVAAHVDHLRYGFELLNRWARGEDPWADASDVNYGASWERQQVSDEQWRALRTALANEAHAWVAASGQRRDWDDVTLTAALSSAVHLAYHVGAIRQIQHAASGPAAAD
jgi:hypothetical protein